MSREIAFVAFVLVLNIFLHSQWAQASKNVQQTAQPRDLNGLLKSKFIIFARHGFEEHNNFRALHHVSPLKWSDKLSIQAQKLAYKMALKGTIQIPGIDLFGENRAKLSAVNFDCETAGEEATKIWYNQGGNYSYADPRLNSNTDSFTQVIWKGTRDVGMGCAQRKGTLSNDIFVVALYYPPGNSPRALRQNVVSPNRNVNDAYSSIFRRRDELYKTKRARLLMHTKVHKHGVRDRNKV